MWSVSTVCVDVPEERVPGQRRPKQVPVLRHTEAREYAMSDADEEEEDTYSSFYYQSLAFEAMERESPRRAYDDWSGIDTSTHGAIQWVLAYVTVILGSWWAALLLYSYARRTPNLASGPGFQGSEYDWKAMMGSAVVLAAFGFFLVLAVFRAESNRDIALAFVVLTAASVGFAVFGFVHAPFSELWAAAAKHHYAFADH